MWRLSDERKKPGPRVVVEADDGLEIKRPARSAASTVAEVEKGDNETFEVSRRPREPEPDPAVRSSLWAPSATLGEMLSLAENERVSLELSAGQWVVLRRFDPTMRREPVFFISAGWMETMQVGEILSLVQTLRRDGELVCAFDDCTKVLYIQRGEIVCASSTLADDRLGQLLFARGKIDRDALEEADRAVAAGKKFGRYLLEKGIFSQHDLYAGVQEQLEAIVLSLFSYAKGSFVFIAKPLDADVSVVRLPKQLMFYMLEGSRQSDEIKEALGKVSARMACFKATGKRWTGEESENVGMERDVLAQVDGVSRTWQILARSGWSETNTLMALARLLRAGVIDAVVTEDKPAASNPVRLPAASRAGTVPSFSALDLSKQLELVERFNVFLRDLRWAMVEQKCDAKALDGFFGELSPDVRAIFSGIEIAGDGSIDAKRIAGNVDLLELPPQEARTQLRAALEELTQFALWTVEDQLGPDAAAKLKQAAKELLLGA